MLETALFVLGVALAAALYGLFKLKAERDVALQRLGDAEHGELRLRESFGALAHETLQKNSAQFLALAEQKLAAREATAVGELDKRRAAVDQLLLPIGEALKRTQDELRKLETTRVEAYSSLRTQVQAMQQSNAQLSLETQRLVQALSKPTVRGRYGELQLQRVAELAGMQNYCDFALQESVRDSSGKLLKPDMVVRLPNERVIAVDAKTNIDAYLEALKAATPERAQEHLKRFADHVADQATALGRKGYWAQFDSPEFTVMFVPGDQFVDAALEHRPDLIELAARANVVLASPSTLIGLLRAVHLGWREQRFGDSARELQELGRELLERFGKSLEHADKVGTSLRRAVDDYNSFVGSVDARVIPTLRKFEESGAKSKNPIKELTPVDGALRRSQTALELGSGTGGVERP
ncbi:MAG: DNA recombination protein RmuC [Planctomycetes bacterium]|nr:DNA recombination protein RmuC [Planctomycetota bacterium]